MQSQIHWSAMKRHHIKVPIASINKKLHLTIHEYFTPQFIVRFEDSEM